jgi:3-hydroxymyristoyl/3-hydroxydecanoyl-(acyl carrier protein) dehydratase
MLNGIENPKETLAYFSSIDKAKFRRPVTPGDQLVLEVEMLGRRRNLVQLRGKAFVDGQLVAEADMMAAIVPKTDNAKNAFPAV